VLSTELDGLLHQAAPGRLQALPWAAETPTACRNLAEQLLSLALGGRNPDSV
jgi:hypothetical protein